MRDRAAPQGRLGSCPTASNTGKLRNRYRKEAAFVEAVAGSFHMNQPLQPLSDGRGSECATEPRPPAWHVMGHSVRGASHARSGLPNQDAIGWVEDADCAGGVLLAVADGHGSAKCFRSECGSRFAVDVAKSVLGSLAWCPASELTTAPSRSRLGIGASEPRASASGTWDPGDGLAPELVRRWRQIVQDHLCENPIPASALLKLERKLGKAARRSVESDPVLAYGSTLLVTGVSESMVFHLQLGDGDILTVSDGAEVSRPWPRDEGPLGDETASLATRDAAAEMRLQVTRAPASMPALILLSTDGYANSFREDGGFLAVGRDLLRTIHTEGIAPIRENLECWLREASDLGSGDDITVGILWRA